MIGRLFKKEETLYSQLLEKEIFDNLVKYSIGGNLENEKIKTFFRGKFDRDNHKFSLMQIFDYGPNNQIRPEISGEIETSTDSTIIHLKIKLPKFIELLLDFAIILNISAFIVFLFLPLPESFPREVMLFGIPIAFVLMIVIGKGFFNSKYSDCEILLKRIVQSK